MALLNINKPISSIMLRNDFIVAQKYLPLIILAAMVDCYFSYFKAFYTVYKKTVNLIPSVALGAAVNITACVALIPQIGIMGACVASFICYMTQGIYRLLDTRHFADLEMDLRTTLICFICILAETIFIICRLTIVGVLVFVFMVMILGIINRDKAKRFINKLLRML